MIKVGIVGYGNLGKALEGLIEREESMELVKIFTRRNPESIPHEKIEAYDRLLEYKDQIDVLVLAVGSATDIPEMAPEIIIHFNTVDSFDTHAKIPAYFDKMNKLAKENNTCAFLSTGWDPGLFSMQRMLAESVLPQGRTFTFWGKGVSQGHGDAVRRVDGVKYAVQYTVPKQEIMDHIREEKRALKSFETHTREVFVVAKEGADTTQIEQDIKTMKNYFDEYETTVHFISEEEFFANHQKMPHGGHVIRVGDTLGENKEVIDFSLNLESNPEFTAAVDIACIKALVRYQKEKAYGAHTVLDTPVLYYSGLDHSEAIAKYL